jgi:phage shock protein B
MSDNLTAIFLAALVILGPTWITFHYLYKFRSAKGLASRDLAAVEALTETAARMEARMAMLEHILDDQAPGWRTDDRVAAAPYQRSRP